MKKSIFFAFIIFAITIGWLASGQFGKVSAQDNKKSEEINIENETNINLAKLLKIII